MTDKEAMKLALDALDLAQALLEKSNHHGKILSAYTTLKERLAQPEQEPMAWGVDWGKAGDIPCVSIIKRLHGGGIEVVAVEYAPYSNAHPPQRTEQNFCSRCGKRTPDLITIHTCTPPREGT